MECKIYGFVTFEIEMVVDTHSNELEEELTDRYKTMFEDMDPDILLRKLLYDNTINVELKETEFTEVE
jgi:hypothetical protein